MENAKCSQRLSSYLTQLPARSLSLPTCHLWRTVLVGNGGDFSGGSWDIKNTPFLHSLLFIEGENYINCNKAKKASEESLVPHMTQSGALKIWLQT